MESILSDLELIPEAVFAKAIGKQVQSLRNDRNLSRGPPYVKVGCKVFYRRDELKAFIEAHTVRPETTQHTMIHGKVRRPLKRAA
jgi:hypothetical protein